MSTYKTLITQDRLDELVRLCQTTPFGAIYELGVYRGGSSLLLAEEFPKRIVLGIDTFTGLPKEQWNKDEVHQPGDFSDTTHDAVYNYVVVENNCSNYYPIKGFFPECAANISTHLPMLAPSFVHVDFDFYEGAKAAIAFFKSKMLAGGVMVFDDYQWPNCPGVERALKESGLPYQPTKAKYQAYIQF